VLDDLLIAQRISDGLLQTVVHRRHKMRRTIVVTSRRIVENSGKNLGDNTMSTTILDRLMHRSALLAFGGKCYRLKEAALRIASASAA